MRRRLFKTALVAGMSTPTFAGAAGTQAMPNWGTVDVRQFGAKGDGLSNDAPAINRAIQYLRDHQIRVGKYSFVPRLVFPTAVYAVDSSINLTRLQALNAVISGEGAVILGRCREQPVIDALGSRWLTIRDLTIVGDREATPKLGLQIGRLADGRVADNHRLENVKFIGDYKLACLLNLAAETTGFDHVFCWNDRADPESYCLIQDGLNHFGTASAFVPDQKSGPEHDLSFNENEFINCDFRHLGGGITVWMGDTGRHRFYRCYASSDGAACFLIFCGPNGHSMLDIDCHCERRGLQNVSIVTGKERSTKITGFSYKEHVIFANRAVFSLQDPIWRVEIQNANIQMGWFFFHRGVVLDNPAAWQITGQLYMSDPQFWNGEASFSGRALLGNQVYELRGKDH